MALPRKLHRQIMREQIESTAAAARAGGQTVRIDTRLPTVCVHLGPDQDYFFQEHEATDLLQDAERTADEFGTYAEEVILWQAQGW